MDPLGFFLGVQTYWANRCSFLTPPTFLIGCDWIQVSKLLQLWRLRSSSWLGSFVSLPPWGHWYCVAVTCAALYRLLGRWYSTHAGGGEQRHGTTAISRAKNDVLWLQPVPLTKENIQKTPWQEELFIFQKWASYILYSFLENIHNDSFFGVGKGISKKRTKRHRWPVMLMWIRETWDVDEVDEMISGN